MEHRIESDDSWALAHGRGCGTALALVLHDAVTVGQALLRMPKAGMDTQGGDLL